MNRYNYRRTQTIEKTGKIWKLQTLCAIACGLCGAGLLAAAKDFPESNRIPMISGWMMIGGFAWLIFARVGAWWFHG